MSAFPRNIPENVDGDCAVFENDTYVELKADKYYAVIAQSLGSCVVRLRDDTNKMEVFRYKESNELDTINVAREIWGLPTLFLPNRFDGGVLKTSDGCYNFPINEQNLNNYLHGFVHKRSHKVEEVGEGGGKAWVTTSYLFDENDLMFTFFPIRFEIRYTFTLSANGLVHKVDIKNLSDKMLPISLCTHTCISSPIVDGGSQDSLRISVPIVQRCELNERCLPTEKLLPLSKSDLEYKNGTKCPVLQNISNDMFSACMNKLDGEDFYGIVITDEKSGRKVCNEVSKEYIFWNIWNDCGKNGYFCPEPMTAMINAPNLSLSPEITGYKEIKNGEVYSAWQRFFTL